MLLWILLLIIYGGLNLILIKYLRYEIHVKEFKAEDFSHEGITEVGSFIEIHFEKTIEVLEYLRKEFNKTKERKY